MLDLSAFSELYEWSHEINSVLIDSQFLSIALFSEDRELIFMNRAFKSLINVENPVKSIINPDFDKLLSLRRPNQMIFEGFMTIGDYHAENTSIVSQVFYKEGKFLILGGINSAQLIEQNIAMNKLFQDVNNLQRELIREKDNLERTLEKLNEAHSELKILNDDKDRFFRILAHDLRSPFTSLLGFSDLLLENLKEYDIDTIEKYIGIIYQTQRKTFDLLENLLLWSRSQSGRLIPDKQKLNLNNVCKEVIGEKSSEALKKDIVIKNTLGPDEYIFFDKQMFMTILRNLISNAIKFSYKFNEIEVYSEKEGDKAVICVSDKGVGIDPEDQKKIFRFGDAFSKPGTENEKGTGLGLSLCYEFVKLHNCDIKVESEPQKGSTFKFTAPVFNPVD
jgi:signal transduction histidine kinase